MRILDWNRRTVQNLTAWEIWFFVVGRVLVGFGLGILVMKYLPDFAAPVGIPVAMLGVILLVIAVKGLRRKHSASSDIQI